MNRIAVPGDWVRADPKPEIDRAMDNLVKSGKFFPMGLRRDSAPMGRQYGDLGLLASLWDISDGLLTFLADPRMGGRPPSIDYDPMRSHSASNLQNFYANQRYQPRQGEPDQMQQAKRRMAAQRERELRNYHQEQQYHRSRSGPGYRAEMVGSCVSFKNSTLRANPIDP
jgi:hypothetical protein